MDRQLQDLDLNTMENFMNQLNQHHSSETLNIGGLETLPAAQKHKGQDGTYVMAPGWGPIPKPRWL